MLDEIMGSHKIETAGLIRNWIKGKISHKHIVLNIISDINSANRIGPERIGRLAAASQVKGFPRAIAPIKIFVLGQKTRNDAIFALQPRPCPTVRS